MVSEAKKKTSETSAKGFRIDPEIFLAGCIVAAIALGWIGLARDQSGALVAALMLGVLALVTADLVWSLDFRRALAAAPPEGKTEKDIASEQKRFNALHRPLSMLAGGLAFVILTGWVVVSRPMLAPAWWVWAYSVLAAVLVIGALLWWLGPRVATDVGPSERPGDGGPYARWLRFSAIILWLTIPSYVGSTATEYGAALAYLTWFVWLAGALAFIAALELMVGAGWALVAPRAHALPRAPLPTFLGSWLLDGAARLIPWGARPERAAPGREPRLIWLTQFLQHSTPRVLIGLIAILWLTTALTQVGVNEQGVRERLGRCTEEVLEPGVHLSWPWPIDRVRRFPARKLQVMQIGYKTAEVERKLNLIWTEAHGIEEDRFVTASGSEVISFDIDIYYRISDVLKFAYAYEDPETMLREIAYLAVMLRTHAVDTDTLLGRDRAALAEGLREDIQADCDAASLGIEVPQVTIIAIHPPFEVAAAYQAVVSAQVRRDTLAIQASTYMEEIIPAARAQAQTTLDDASAYAAERVATARGEAAGFTLLVGAVRQDPLVYRFRRRIEALETGLEGKRLYVVSSDFLISEGEGHGIWFDLR